MLYPVRCISVIIPAKNEEMNITACIKSITSNTVDDLEIEVIVVDNGSTDKTAALAEAEGVVVLHNPRGTIAMMRNLGVRHCRGELLAFVDADVFVSSDWLSSALKVLDETGAVCVGCSPEIPEDGTWVERAWHRQIDIRASRCQRSWLASMNMLVYREPFVEAGGFDETLSTCEDVDLGYRLGRYGTIVFDKSIKAVHLGEAKTIFRLFKKESWRGRSNFDGILRHGYVREELRSNIVACLYFLFYPSVLLSLALGRYGTAVALLGASMLLPSMKTYLLTRGHTPGGHHVPVLQIFLVWLTYCWARGYSGFIWCADRAFGMLNPKASA